MLLGSLFAGGCADPCQDDGLLQESCDAAATQDSETRDDGSSASSGQGTADGGGSAEGAGSADGEGSGSNASAGSGSADTTAGANPDLDVTGATSDSASDGGNDGPWCADADGDGFGDPEQCSDRPEPGTVNNDDDCNDDDPSTFPGAAELEPDVMLCTTDTDGDGWGDAMPGEGAVAGADCWDDDPLLNPSLVHVSTIDNGPLADVVATIDLLDASLSVVAPIDTPLLGLSTTAAVLRSSGQAIAMDQVSGRLQRIEYMGVCDGSIEAGNTTPFGPDFSSISICGLGIDGNDRLWAVDASSDVVLELDPDSGLPMSSLPLMFGGALLDIDECDLTWECHTDRLLLAHGSVGKVLELDTTTGQTTLVAEYDPDLGPAGIAYDPVSRAVWVSTGIQLNEVPLDGTPATEVGLFTYDGAVVTDIADLALLETCG